MKETIFILTRFEIKSPEGSAHLQQEVPSGANQPNVKMFYKLPSSFLVGNSNSYL
jgi:hypothetical protein